MLHDRKWQASNDLHDHQLSKHMQIVQGSFYISSLFSEIETRGQIRRTRFVFRPLDSLSLSAVMQGMHPNRALSAHHFSSTAQ
jgi:hypothetical protein